MISIANSFKSDDEHTIKLRPPSTGRSIGYVRGPDFESISSQESPTVPRNATTLANRHPANFLAIVFALIAMAGCGTTARSTGTSSEAKPLGAPTRTVYNAPPIILQTEAQKRDAGVNAIVGWHADLDDAEGDGAKTIGKCNGTMQVTRIEDDREHRMTMIEIDWDGSSDSIVAGGSHPYPKKGIETTTPIVRGVLGGTGTYANARGEVVSTRLPSGWYRHEIWLFN